MLRSTLQLIIALLLLGFQATAQDRSVSGKVSSSDGEALIGATIKAKGATAGANTDIDGKFTIRIPAAVSSLVFSYTGYTDREVAIPASGDMNVTLEVASNTLGEVVISTGSRASQRTITDSPLPIDVIGFKDLQSTGQTTFDKALQYRVPSFNSVNTPVNDATTLLDPYEIRNLGPSRTLILINGKRKNLSSLLYVQFSPGRGETGVDLSAIPTDAIKRVEILRDGASAQYGSDAIAGVMNVILKDRYEYSSLNLSSGVTTAGDGATYGISFNSGANFGERGFLNYTLAFNQQDNAIRSGTVDLVTEIATFGNPSKPQSDPANQPIVDYLKKYPTANNLNGTGEITAAKFLINGGIPVAGLGLLYANAAAVTKKVFSNANYRTPYWKEDYGLLHAADEEYIGYMPTFEGDLFDYNATIGVKDEHNGWNHDLSFTVGGNSQLYTVENTVNHSLGANSPTSFKPGGFNFHHVVGNFDISKALTDKFSIAFGSEARSETFQIIAGDTASFSGEGANSFPGIRADNAKTNSRFNLGAYFDASYDITSKWLINGTVRAEKYSDFGEAYVWKTSSRYKISNKVVLRGSVSTGFRAPTLHQIYAQSTQASFADGFIQLSGLFNNKSVPARLLGIPSLKPEKSTNYTIGIGLSPTKNLNITLDYYSIKIKDRIVYSSSITSSAGDSTSTLYNILKAANVKSVQFFINGVETNTQGIDYVVSYRNIGLGTGTLGINLAGNITLKNEIVGKPNDPEAINKAGSSILNEQIQSLLTEGRPLYKTILGFDYAIGRFNFNLNNTLFGPTRFQDLDNDYDVDGESIMKHIKQEFKPAVVTDLNIGYNINKKVTISVTANNLLNVLPKWELVAIDNVGQAYLDNEANKNLLIGSLGFSGRYSILGYNGSQFSQLGTILNANLNVRF
jgi:iron complex outermembrane receptor protein